MKINNMLIKNYIIMKTKFFTIIAAMLAIGNLWASQETKLYTFDDNVSLETNWDVNISATNSGVSRCEITQSIHEEFVLKDGNYLGFYYQYTNGITITSTAVYEGIAELSLDLIADDNTKPLISAYIITDQGEVELFAPVGSKEGFNTGGTKKWGTKTVTTDQFLTGKIKIVTTCPLQSTAKCLAIDNIKIIYGCQEPVSPLQISANKTTDVYAGDVITFGATGGNGAPVTLMGTSGEMIINNQWTATAGEHTFTISQPALNGLCEGIDEITFQVLSTDSVKQATISGKSLANIGDTILLTCSAEHATAFQWYADGNIIEGATSEIYEFVANAIGQYNFSCEASNMFNNTSVETNQYIVRVLDVDTIGTCGEFLTWFFTAEDSTLTIEGSGAMDNWTTYNTVPWYDYKLRIAHISLSEGMTSIGDFAFYHCDSLKSIFLPNSIVTIGYRAFRNCEHLKSIVIPDNVTSLGEGAFQECYALEEVTIGAGVIALGKSVFNQCSLIQTVNWNATNYRQQKPNEDANGFPFYSARNSIISISFGEGVTYIPSYLLKEVTTITAVTLPNSVKEIGLYSFYGCSNLQSITIGENLSSVEWNAFSQCHPNFAIYVPCGMLDAYKKRISSYASKMRYAPFPYTLSVLPQNNTSDSLVSKDATACNEEAVYNIWATPSYGYHFTKWNDGNTENPRAVILTQDTTFIAEFDFDKSGTCGENLALTWEYDSYNKALTISGEGALTNNYTFGLEAPVEVEKLIISEGITAIGNSAFSEYSTLKHISIAESVKTIYEQAFYNCTNLKDIYCYREKPSTAYSNTFDGIDKFECTLHVLSASVDMYRVATGWRDFYYIQTIDAETITDAITSVVITPTENTANIIWPVVEGALSYEITITKDDQTVCTLTFNAQGQLIGIAFAPAREMTKQQQAEGFRFTITGLTNNTQYGYSIVAKDANNNTLDTKSGSFTTTGEIPTAIEDVQVNSVQCTKILRDGQIFILRGNKTYTLQGQEIK